MEEPSAERSAAPFPFPCVSGTRISIASAKSTTALCLHFLFIVRDGTIHDRKIEKETDGGGFESRHSTREKDAEKRTDEKTDTHSKTLTPNLLVVDGSVHGQFTLQW